MRVAIDIRRAGDFGIGTYIRNIVNQFARADDGTEYLLIGQQSHLAEFDPLPENFELLDYPSEPGLLPHAHASALPAAQARRRSSAHALVLCAGRRPLAPGDHGSRLDRRAHSAARHSGHVAGRAIVFRAARPGARRPHHRRVPFVQARTLARLRRSGRENRGRLQRARRTFSARADARGRRPHPGTPCRHGSLRALRGKHQAAEKSAAPDRSVCRGQSGAARSSRNIPT